MPEGAPKPLEVALPGVQLPMLFVPIPAGTFRMGQRGEDADEEPVTEVKVGAFWMACHPVTQEEFAAWTGTEEYAAWFAANRERIKRTSFDHEAEPHANGFPNNPRHPADSVTWWEARAFAEWVEASGAVQQALHAAGIPETEIGSWRLDLPGEAQWEYVCRAGTETEYWRGDGEAALAEVGWYGGNANGETHAVKGKPGNAWGLFDMHGNVWEWCRDAWDERVNRLRIPGQEDERGSGDAAEDGELVLRGGSWFAPAWSCRAACRFGLGPGGRHRLVGFRLAVVPGPSSQQGPEARPEAEHGAGAAEPRDEAEQAQAAGGADRGTASFPRRSGGGHDQEPETHRGS